ncbi:bacterial transcriptional activator domain-containing protein [Streptomyces sp. NBC_01232]|uniref:AfsR/SARP family transcriptional regulator n=1 Tax=Streptomyces sp. NBC_01232 TaxID=2903786 RepID=UPI002E0F4E7D|nr:bacterial transcriptional activator domain-containing protein [Streptomyces sp. NBC_01232]WSQ03172.1 bacterial transcriptional activator domain-containing protein [Streptomyces sp. NBC_01232]
MLIRLIGLVTIEPDGAPPQHLSSAQAQVAFARLLLERAGGTDRDQLAETIWPEGLPDTWASALRSLVSRVRTFVTTPQDGPGATPLVSQGGRYLLRVPRDAVVDVEVAETALAEAAEAYAEGAYAVAAQLAAGAVSNLRGSFLPSHEGEWVNAMREQLEELRLKALETASLSSSALGDEHHALRYAEEAVRRAPFRESAYRCRMAAHTRAGNRAEALRSYQQLREVLAEELGIDPAPETEAAYLELLRTPEPRPAVRSLTCLDPVLMGVFEVDHRMPVPRPCSLAEHGCVTHRMSSSPAA